VLYYNITVRMEPIDIAYITGENGSGKSVLVKALEKDLGDEAVNIDWVEADPGSPSSKQLAKASKKA